jgi:nucleotide-binding universal stress UspA family protein
MIEIKNLLVATDYSDDSNTALTYGRALGRAYGATLHVVNVLDNLFTITGLEGYIGDAAGLSQDVEQTARRQLDAVISEDDRRTLHARGVLLSSDRPARAIARYAKDAKIDLMVIGTRGHGRLWRLLLGSVTERIIELAPCPVLVVRHPEHEFVVPDAPAGVRRRV